MTTSLSHLCASVWALSAVRVAAESDLLATMAGGETNPEALARKSRLAPAIAARILETLEANGFVERKDDGFVLSTEGADLAARADWLRADLAVTFGQCHAFVVESRRTDLASGWQHHDAEIIRSQSTLSRILTERAIDGMLAGVPGLERLGRPGAKLLDVGTGGAGVAIAFCRRFPSLRVVGLDPLRAANLEARTAIDVAGLSDRIEVRSITVETLSEENMYDAAFVASSFLDDATLCAGLGRVSRALVPGGTALLHAWRSPEQKQLAAAAQLRWQLWGGSRSPADAIRIAKAAGLVDVREGPAAGLMVPVIGSAPG